MAVQFRKPALSLGLLAAFCLVFAFYGCGEDGPPVSINGDNQSKEASCDDGIQNGNESDVDCGGSACEPCAQGRSCENSNDCTTGLCDRGTCVDEECVGVDCLAGQSCYRGDCFQGCQSQEDCPDAGRRCVGGACVPRDCSGVACGDDETCYEGGCYPTCEGAQDCSGDDVQCLENACVTPLCDDGIQSGEETDIDCGGSVCGGCDEGQSCLGNADCLQETNAWSECEFEEGNICASAGVQTREIYELECSDANICSGQVEVETRDCQRDTDGDSCGEEQVIEEGDCEPAETPVDCSAGGVRMVTKVVPSCADGQCVEDEVVQSEECELNTTGLECSPTAACVASAQCSAGGTCEITDVASGSCFIDGTCYDDGDPHPQDVCQGCNPSNSATEWSNVDCGTTITGTSNPGEAIPDDSWDGVVDHIDMSSCPEILEIQVSVDITHPNRGHLVVVVTPPSGDPEATIQYHSGFDREDLVATYPNDLDPSETGIDNGNQLEEFIGADGTGQWEIHVVDDWSDETGTFNNWTLELTCL